MAKRTRKSALLLVVTMFLTGCKGREGESGNTYRIPPGVTPCLAGDYIIKKAADQAWGVFLVESVVLVDRLAPVNINGSEFVEEIHFHDSTRPEGWHEVHFILTAYKATFRSKEEATQAIEGEKLGEYTEGLCRKATFFPKENCQVYRKNKKLR
ncbi:MAG: hypothetical protein C5B50_05055 [Verrucomicrobia bacterium]|nr:MAG: hypothetical protein C5B50_05055 [Verrucomicrobiota bacterium]